MRVGIGFSSENNSKLAGEKAVEKALKEVNSPSLIFLFATDHYDQEAVWKGVTNLTAKTPLVGASVAGIIAPEGVVLKGVGACALEDPRMEVVTCLQGGPNFSPYQLGEEAGRKLQTGRPKGENSGTVFLFPDGFAADVTQMLRGLYQALGPDYTYLGGGAGDNLRFYKTFQFTEKGVASGSLAVALVQGVNFKIGTGHGWKPAGPPMVITRARGKTVYEIDGRPAFESYSEYLGGIDRDKFSYFGMKHPLGIPGKEGSFIIRDPLKIGENDSIVFVTEVPQNSVATIMQSDIEDLIAAAGEVAASAVDIPGTPGIALVFYCVSRFLLLEASFDREIEMVKANLGLEVPLFGMLSFGEVSSFSGVPLFYNKTIVIAAGW